VDYCYVSNRWYLDHDGDQAAWRQRCESLYAALFAPHAERSDAPSYEGFTPGGWMVGSKYFEYERGTGFEGKMPEFHGDFDYGIAKTPAFCPFCVYDENLCIHERINQITTTDKLHRHLSKQHIAQIDNASQTHSFFCPIPACGRITFDSYQLKVHLIKVHRLPVCGAKNTWEVSRLILPVAPDHPSSSPNPNPAAGPSRILADSSTFNKRKAPSMSRPARTAPNLSKDYRCSTCQVLFSDILYHYDSGECPKNAKGDFYYARPADKTTSRRKWPRLPTSALREEMRTEGSD